MRPRALIAEDEPLLARSLETALAAAWPELEIASTAANGIEALAAAERHRPQVAFLDIRMPGLDGLELAAELADRLGEDVPAIVFVTAYDEYALKAFDHAAVDYLLKPIDAERLGRCVERLKARLTEPAGLERLVTQLNAVVEAQPPGKREALHAIRAGVGNEVRLIPLGDVCYFRADDKYTSVVSAAGEALIRTPLKELLPQLPGERFRQVHRSTVVNMDEVVAAVRDDTGRVSLKLRRRKETLAVSRVYAHLFKPM